MPAEYWGYQTEESVRRLNPALLDLCHCGHRRGDHQKAYTGQVRFECQSPACKCRKFRWQRHLPVKK